MTRGALPPKIVDHLSSIHISVRKRPIRKTILAIFVPLFLFLPLLSFAASITAKVVDVRDGHTLSVVHKGRTRTIRLAGIACPKKQQPFGPQAKQFTLEMVLGKKVDIKITDREKSGRILGEVFLMDGRNLNRELVKAGLAWWYRKISKDITLGQLEQQARANRAGLWKEPEPIPPWEFKKPPKKAEHQGPSTAMK